MTDQTWLTDLVDEYQTANGPSAGQIRRLAATFNDFAPAVMAAAVKKYMLSGARFFPRVGELLAFVKEADHAAGARRSYSPDQRQALDGRLMTYEQTRGSMPASDEIDAEISAARADLAKIDISGVVRR